MPLRPLAIRSILFLTSVAAVVGPALIYASRLDASPEITVSQSAQSTPAISQSGYDVTPLSTEKINELATILTPEEAKIILRSGTEPAFCGTLLDNKQEGVYTCRLCGLPLFDSNSKYDSGSGWPSFFQPADPQHVTTVRDTSHGMIRDEIRCTRCTAHLGHVFTDGPKPTGLRFCLNSASLEFYNEADLPERSRPLQTETAYFAGGCFWGIEDRLQHTEGVITAISGYQGGEIENPTYRQICYTDTGHAESVKVVYNPAVVTYRELLEKYFTIHDPTQLNRQGPDVGTQYRSEIFADNDGQLAEATAFIKELQQTERFKNRTIVTKVSPMATFWDAEEYHQDYHLKNGGSCALPGD